MYINIFDTEGTGIGNKDEVIQIAGVITDMDLNIIRFYNEYCLATQDIAPEAYAVHNLDREALYKLSKGKYFEDVLDTMPWFKNDDMLFISYNAAYDKRMINQTLVNMGFDKIDFGAQVQAIRKSLRPGRYNMCAMTSLRGPLNKGVNMQLGQAVQRHSKYNLEALEGIFKLKCKQLGYVPKTSNLHDALFDSYVLWALLVQYKGLIYR